MSKHPGQTNRIGRKRPQITRVFLLICFQGLMCLSITSCRQEFTPKPVAYPRLSYPPADYKKTDHLPYPIFFEYPAFARLEILSKTDKNGNWVNLHFDKFKATLFTSYFCASEKDIQQHLIENESILEKETPPYAHIHKQKFESSDSATTGYLYETGGNTACPVQFIITDKHRQLFRGALYFNYLPNRDSIKDILNGLSGDIRYLMESFRFKN